MSKTNWGLWKWDAQRDTEMLCSHSVFPQQTSGESTCLSFLLFLKRLAYRALSALSSQLSAGCGSLLGLLTICTEEQTSYPQSLVRKKSPNEPKKVGVSLSLNGRERVDSILSNRSISLVLVFICSGR